MAAKTNSVNGKETDAKSLKKYFRGVRSEFKKVIWPTKKQWINYSLIVISVSIVTALFIYIIDYIMNILMSFIVGL